ncbi:hypothetical protein Pmani_031260 [Petrolisthes manimaculis]|uniref:Uncharacterized protein n=1 Tax=Petrolisthes manimaculis TaxID=1843537 RepID=A0AAE1NVQ0_9EUCA|nr:hypothetical protein Pmani_031260 [Petrolisthes manimaculis]
MNKRREETQSVEVQAVERCDDGKDGWQEPPHQCPRILLSCSDNKKSSISPPGRPWRDRNLVMSAAFAFADPNLSAPCFKSTGGRLLKV